jgi:hypothetical protein
VSLELWQITTSQVSYDDDDDDDDGDDADDHMMMVTMSM